MTPLQAWIEHKLPHTSAATSRPTYSLHALAAQIEYTTGEPVCLDDLAAALIACGYRVAAADDRVNVNLRASAVDSATRRPAAQAPLLEQDRIEAEHVLADIRRRPAYHLCCIWAERHAPTPARSDEVVGVHRVREVIKRAWALDAEEITVLCALRDSGFDVRPGDWQGWTVNLPEQILLDALAQHAQAPDTAAQARFAKYSDQPAAGGVH